MTEFSMNPQRQRHMEQGIESHGAAGGGEREAKHGKKKPHIHIHEAGGQAHVHIMHDDQPPEVHQHDMGDADGIAAHVHEHYGNGMPEANEDENELRED